MQRNAAVLAIVALLAACGGGGGGGSDGAAAPAPSPTLEFTATPRAVANGGSAVLSWTTTNVRGCEASGGWTGPKAASGLERVGPVAGTTAFLLRCFAANTTDSVSASVTVEVNSVQGQLLLSSVSQVDSDVNDPSAPYQPNDSLLSAQLLPNPVVVGGYVNAPGRGPVGRSSAAGDLDDIFRVNLEAGQVIELVVPAADPAAPDALRNDADLALYDADGNLVDESMNLGPVEQLTVSEAGTYYLRVALYSGALLYRLAVGQSSLPVSSGSLRLSDDFVAGELVVKMRPDAGGTTRLQKPLDALTTRLGLRAKAGHVSREQLLSLPGDAANRLAAEKTANPASRDTGLRVPAELEAKRDTLRYLKRLRTEPGVELADPNRLLRTSLVPNDPGYAIQAWHYGLIQLPSAWEITTGRSDVIVAVVDTGVVPHPDLDFNLIPGYDFVRDPQNGDGNGLDPVPDDPGCRLGGSSVYHGAHVAGTVAALGQNRSGVAGVAWNARVMPVRALDGCSGGGTLYDIQQGIRYAAGLPNDSGRLPERPADVINLSLGGKSACDNSTAALVSQVRERGIMVVAAAGNENRDIPTIPAACPGVIAVSAVGPTAEKAAYSNFGASWVDVAAPGGELRFDLNGDGFEDGVLSTFARGSGSSREPAYALLQGTSMAAPHVAGVLALMKSMNLALRPADVDALLLQGRLTDDIGPPGPDSLGTGLINAYKAVLAASADAPSLPALLTLTPSALSFGDVGSRTEVVARNGGSEALVVDAVIATDPWIRVAPHDTDPNGLGVYEISIERGALAAGVYSGGVDFLTSAGTQRLPVLMEVAAIPTRPSGGLIYVLAADAETERTISQTTVIANNSATYFRVDALPAGDYLLIAGSDMDNNLTLCEDGEACGAYPVENKPETVPVLGNVRGYDFTAVFRSGVAVETASPVDPSRDVAAKSGYTRLAH